MATSSNPQHVVPTRCRVCASTTLSFAFEVEPNYPDVSRAMRRYFACDACGTLLDAAGIPPSYELRRGDREPNDRIPSVQFYLEVGAGIDAFATIIGLLRTALGPARLARPVKLLEVGAGFGFTLSLARSVGWDATGLEPSVMGRVGRAVLGVEILPQYLEDSRLPPGAFDCLVSAEVIEHVADPSVFVATVARWLAPDGLLFLTTPNGEVVREGPGVEREWYDALSPGFHMNLLSPRAIRDLLGRHGFGNVRLAVTGGSSGRKQIVTIASRAEAPLPAVDWDAAAQRAAQGLTEDYLRYLVENPGESDVLLGGALFRLVQNLTNRGEYAAAMPLVKRIDAVLRKRGLDEDTLGRIEPADFDAYLARVPAFAGLYEFARGIIMLNHVADYAAAARSFSTAAHLCRTEDRVGYFPRAGWFERAKFHQGLSLIHAGKSREALAVFDGLLAAPERIPAEHREQVYALRELASV